MGEKERLSALYSYAVLDTEQEVHFDNIVQLASQICNTPVSLITLLDLDRQWFKAKVGVDFSETPRDVSFCTHTLGKGEVLVIPDTTKDERVSTNPLVTAAPFVRFYAGAPLITPEGHVLGTLCVLDQQARELSPEQLFALQTLSQQVVSQLELRVKIRKLNSLVETKNKILSIIAHDVKGPLANIKQLLKMFTADEVPHEDMTMLSGRMLDCLDKADTLLSELLNWFLSQIEDGEGKFEEIDLSALLEEVIEENSAIQQQKNNTLISRIDTGLLTLADQYMLKFVFRNLLGNAGKYTRDGAISLTASETDHGILISVKDTGVGIDQARLEKIFRWDRIKSTAGTANEKGHGLGLLLAQEFVLKHQGRIEIFSEAGKGTEVQVCLPNCRNNKLQSGTELQLGETALHAGIA